MQPVESPPQAASQLYSQSEKERSELFVKFIDVLFAVVIGQSFGFLSSAQGGASWVTNISQNVIALGDAVLFYALIISSWIGYHASVKSLPIKNVSRFFVDVVLLFSYSLALANLKSFINTSFIISAVFTLYFLWGLIRLFEYADKNVRSQYQMIGRAALSGTFAILFLAVAVLVYVNPDPTIQGIFLSISFALIISYRILLQTKLKWP